MAGPDQRGQAQPTTPDRLLAQADPGQSAGVLVQTSPPLTLVDVGVFGLVLGLALWYLYRQFWRKRGACGGCAKGGAGGCVVSRSIAKLEDQTPSGVCVSVDAIRKCS